MKLRELTTADWPTVLALNQASESDLSPLDEQRLGWIVSMAHRCVVAENDSAVLGFALTLTPRSSYDSENYRWLDSRLDQFLYLDRVVVDAEARRRGVATRIYEEIEPIASQYGRMVCDVNVERPNEASLAFHAKRGYVEIGRVSHHDGHVSALLCKELG